LATTLLVASPGQLSLAVSAESVLAVSNALDGVVLAVGRHAERVADGEWCEPTAVHSLGSSDDLLRAQRLAGRCEHGEDEFEHPAGPWLG
jgi:hypothetical protein